jgi:fumarate hydratase subunit beta
VAALRAGDSVTLTGDLLTIRDASAARLAALQDSGAPLPVDLNGMFTYAVGPSPARPGRVVGSAGPTTTARMAAFLPALLAAGMRGVIGKGELTGAAADELVRHRAVYLAAVGGLGALLSAHVVAAEVVAFPDLGPEAIYRFRVHGFPAVVALDVHGGDLHAAARRTWRKARA